MEGGGIRCVLLGQRSRVPAGSVEGGGWAGGGGGAYAKLFIKMYLLTSFVTLKIPRIV